MRARRSTCSEVVVCGTGLRGRTTTPSSDELQNVPLKLIKVAQARPQILVDETIIYLGIDMHEAITKAYHFLQGSGELRG
jgi:hypothetical protein